jgi:hypothetical protein
VLAETGIGWLPYMVERMDDSYQRFLDAGDFWRAHGGLPLTMAPSAYFRRQVWATFQTDHVGLRLLGIRSTRSRRTSRTWRTPRGAASCATMHARCTACNI